MSLQQNITRIKAVYDALGNLATEVVFVGGATVALYATRPTGEVRPTDDVDVLVELMHHKNYARLDEQLRSKGFINDIESGVICRYLLRGIVVDVMPTHDSVLGFANQWYPEGFRDAITETFDPDYIIKILRPDFFIATKLEAFNDRGGGDGRLSTDFEDIIVVLNNRPEIWNEMKDSPPALKTWLTEQFRGLVNRDAIYEWVSTHLDYVEQRRVNLIVGGMQAFAEMNK
jgi:hypothetical protein